MSIVALLVIVAVVGAVAIVLAGRTGGQADFAPDRPPFVLPDRPITSADVDGIRYAVGARGYRMDQVDDVMDRLSAELAARDAELARLRAGDSTPPDAPMSEPTASRASVGIDDDVLLEPAGAEAPPVESADEHDGPGSVGRA